MELKAIQPPRVITLPDIRVQVHNTQRMDIRLQMRIPPTPRKDIRQQVALRTHLQAPTPHNLLHHIPLRQPDIPHNLTRRLTLATRRHLWIKTAQYTQAGRVLWEGLQSLEPLHRQPKPISPLAIHHLEEEDTRHARYKGKVLWDRDRIL